MSAELVLSGVTKEAIDAAVAAVHRENWDLFAKLDHLESDPVVQARLVKVRPTPDRRRDRRWTPAAPHRSLKGQQSMVTRFAASLRLRTDNSPQRKEAQPTVSRSDIRLIQHLDSSALRLTVWPGGGS
jgi:hypothetical protein